MKAVGAAFTGCVPVLLRDLVHVLELHRRPSRTLLVLTPAPVDILTSVIRCYNTMSRVISADVSEDLAAEIEEEQEEGESRSAVVRRLIRAGLDAEQGRETIPVTFLLIWIGTLLIAMQYAQADGLAGPLGIAFVLSGLLLSREDVRRRLSALRDRYTSDTSDE